MATALLEEKSVDAPWTSVPAAQSIRPYLPVAAGMLLCLAAIYLYHIEESLQLFRLFALATVGFAVNALLPKRLRLGFVFCLNAVAMLLLFGLVPGVGILATALLLFLIVNLQISVNYRIGLLLLAGGILALGKLGYFPFPEVSGIATVVGGLFMFRSMVYLYEMQHERERPGWWLKLNYFFLLPNLIFIIFPVVDYKTFNRSYYQRSGSQIAKKGLLWIMRGLFHLMVYRLVYYYLIPPPSEIVSIFGVIQYMVFSYVLIIRLSGIFHLSVGIICLFGFDLPKTFDNYFLATGFSDLWRRINIYWKDFMMKVFYFPLFFKFKKRDNTAIFITVMAVFFINWILHQYQWFWIRGNFPIRDVDIIFWMVFGFLVAMNSIYQKSRKRKKRAGHGFSWRPALVTTLQIMGMFAFMSVLWSFWTSPGIDHWFTFLRSGGPVTGHQLLLLFAGLLLICTVGVIAHYVAYRIRESTGKVEHDQSLKLFGLGWGLFVLLAIPPLHERIADRVAFDTGPILTTRLNAADQEQLFQGYYESLLVGNNLNSRIWEVEESRKKNGAERHGHLTDTRVSENRDDLLNKVLIPGESDVFKGSRISINALGMRDREYALEKAPATLRIALQGGSSEMGAGINDQDVFDNYVEDSLSVYNDWEGVEKVEIFNFAISGIHLPQQVAITERRIASIDPDVLIYTVHRNEDRRSLRSFATIFKEGQADAYPDLLKIVAAAEFEPTQSEKEVFNAIRPHKEALFDWGLDRISSYCSEHDIIPIALNVSTLGEGANSYSSSERAAFHERFTSRGFLVLDLTDVYQGQDFTKLRIAEFDNHPNAKAHRLVAERLTRELRTHPALKALIEARMSGEN